MNPFEFVKAINNTKEDLIKDSDIIEHEYNPFIVNRAMSYHLDTVLLSNIMNLNSHLDNKLQFQFFLNSVSPRKRFSKWTKPENNENLDLVKTYFHYNTEEAKQVLSLLSDNDIEIIKKRMSKGGRDAGRFDRGETKG